MKVRLRSEFPAPSATRTPLPQLAVMALCVLTLLVGTVSPALAADEAAASNLPKIINFTILATILVLALRKPLASYLEARALQIREQLSEARANREEAARTAERAAQRSASLEDEVLAARQRIADSATAEGRRIVAAAEEQAKRIAIAAEAELHKEVRIAERRLAAGAAQAAVQIARARLRNTTSDDDHQRLLDAGIAAIRRD